MKLTTETCQHGTSKSVMCLFCEAYNAAWTAALTEAARVVEKHHADDSYGACVTCIRPNTDDQHDSYPCPTVLALRTLTTPGGG